MVPWQKGGLTGGGWCHLSWGWYRIWEDVVYVIKGIWVMGDMGVYVGVCHVCYGLCNSAEQCQGYGPDHGKDKGGGPKGVLFGKAR